jgi:serine-type D-Ala-D-Ala carboxypeptidase
VPQAVLRSASGRFILNQVRLGSKTPAGFEPAATASANAELGKQDHRFAAAFQIIEEAVRRKAFPCASIAITLQGRVIGLTAFGRFTYTAESPTATISTMFDLASVSKVVATTSMAMILYERGLLDLELPVADILPRFLRPLENADPRRREITLHHLLAHSSGLPGYEKLYLYTNDRESLLKAALSAPLKYDPGSHAEYSDVGFMILGAALERLADESIDQFCAREVFAPLGMLHTAFNPPQSCKPNIAPTADDKTFRQRIVQGEVQDENASVMGGIAGHAGLFSTPADIASFADAMLRGGSPIVRPETLAIFTRRENSPRGSSRALGWDTPSSPSQSGKYFSQESFGHLGYTGTSLWIDPVRKLSITLLTNRTWPDCANQEIKQIRPRFHDAVIAALEGEG